MTMIMNARSVRLCNGPFSFSKNERTPRGGDCEDVKAVLAMPAVTWFALLAVVAGSRRGILCGVPARRGKGLDPVCSKTAVPVKGRSSHAVSTLCYRGGGCESHPLHYISAS